MDAGARSLADLYRNHRGWLHGLLHRQLGCPETAADLAQDTFVRLLNRDEDVTGIREPRAYLGRIARGLLANHWRHQDIERAYREALAQQPEATGISPEQHHLIVETLYRIDGMLRDLPDKVRQAFLMARLDGVGYRDIGMVLDVSERMVKKYMARAMLHCLTLVEAGDG